MTKFAKQLLSRSLDRKASLGLLWEMEIEETESDCQGSCWVTTGTEVGEKGIPES